MYITVEVETVAASAANGRVTMPEAVGFDEFFAAVYPRLLRLAWALTGRRDVAEEHVQEALFSAHRHWSQVSNLDEPGAWVRRVLINRCVSTARRRATEARLLVRLGSRRAEEIELPEAADELWAQVRRLPARQAQVIALVYLEDLAMAEVAEILECSESTARTHLRRARIALAAALRVDDDTAGGADDQPG